MMDISEKLPLYSVFILFLIIASNYIGELFPCKMQSILVENVYLKHFIAFLTLMFFVVLTDPFIGTSFNKIIENSFKMYVVFLLLINNNKNFFILAIILLGVKKNIIKCYLVGKNINFFQKQIQNKLKFSITKNLKDTLIRIFKDIKLFDLKLNTILLSPAAASYDQFKNFKQRGDKFKKLSKLYLKKYV